jgi:hypothetical protein
MGTFFLSESCSDVVEFFLTFRRNIQKFKYIRPGIRKIKIISPKAGALGMNRPTIIDHKRLSGKSAAIYRFFRDHAMTVSNFAN